MGFKMKKENSNEHTCIEKKELATLVILFNQKVTEVGNNLFYLDTNHEGTLKNKLKEGESERNPLSFERVEVGEMKENPKDTHLLSNGCWKENLPLDKGLETQTCPHLHIRNHLWEGRTGVI